MNHITDAVLSQKVKKVPAMIMSRVSGYYGNLNNFNKGKREEFSERKYLNIDKALNYKGDYNYAQPNHQDRLFEG